MADETQGKSSLRWYVIAAVVVIIGCAGIVWGCPSSTVRASEFAQEPNTANANPFAQAVSRVTRRFSAIKVLSVDFVEAVNEDNRNRVLDNLVTGQGFLRITEGGLTRTALTQGQQAAYREYVDSVLAPGDRMFKFTWSVGAQTFANLGLAAGSSPKLEPILSTTAAEVGPPRVSAVADLQAPRLVLARYDSQGTVKPSAKLPATKVRDEFSVYNMLDYRVAWGALEIMALGASQRPDATVGYSLLWSVSHEAPQTAVSQKGRCMDGLVNMTWSSYLPSITVGVSGGVEFSIGQGITLHSDTVHLQARRCK